ncbi:MAG: hypothetical protein ABSH29_03795 [Acidimicrobiales bacterium]
MSSWSSPPSRAGASKQRGTAPGTDRLRRLDDGTPAVLELELLDPAFFFETHPAAAARFARVLRDMIP